MKKLICLLLVFAMTFSLFACTNSGNNNSESASNSVSESASESLSESASESLSESASESIPESTSESESESSSQDELDVVYKSELVTITKTAFRHNYNLSQDLETKLDAYFAQLDALVESNAPEEEQQACYDEMLELFYVLIEQRNIANALYQSEPKNEEYSKNYEYTSSLINKYVALDYKYEIGDAYEEYQTLMDANDALEMEYDALTKEQFGDSTSVHTILGKVIENNKKIATVLGYENYLEYAYESDYSREYTPADAEVFFDNVKTYISPLYNKAIENFSNYQRNENYPGALDEIYSYIRDSAGKERLGTIASYISTYEQNIADAMHLMFNDGNAMFSKRKNAPVAGAWTNILPVSSTPIAYFSPDYSNAFTLIHEMGHYICFQFDETGHSYDLKETQSQANEAMFLAYLTHTQPRNFAIKALEAYQLYNNISSLIQCAVVGKFEKEIYYNDVDPSDYDRVYNSVLREFNYSDTYSYWKYATVSSPGYYISYAISLVPVLDLYRISMTSYEDAQKAYIHIVSGEEEGFIDRVTTAGLINPMEAEGYSKLESLFN